VQGEETIQEAKISGDGQLIVASTANSVKLFQIRRTFVAGRASIRTRQISLPSTLARLGGRQVGFSPDGKWLYVVRKDNTISLVKLIPSSGLKDPPTIHEKVVKLYPAPEPDADPALGEYKQTITQVAFSDDSRCLAVGDLNGSIYTWLLEGHEDINFIDSASNASDNESDTSSSSSSSSEDNDTPPIIHGQKWLCNPAGSSLPNLDSAILALTFRPSIPSTNSHHTSTQNLGNLALHATRQNPHPISHEISSTSPRLIAITATHTLLEFDISQNKISAWSRRNPPAYLPRSLTQIKERVKGAFWDVTDRANRGERLWLYGSDWLFMLDMSQDLRIPDDKYKPTKKKTTIQTEKKGTLGSYDVLEPIENGSSPSTQRINQSMVLALSDNKTDERAKKRRKRNIGAGDAIRSSERPNGISQTVQKFKHDGDDVEMMDIDMDGQDETGATDDDDDAGAELALLRRTQDQDRDIDGDHEVTKKHEGGDAVAATTRRPRQFRTFAYDSILGIGVFGPDDSTAADETNDGPRNLEIVVVERSMFDVEQVPRFDAEDWNT
jgi:U3 small nucleolar RNA-associated protein 4